MADDLALSARADRGQMITAMGEALEVYLRREYDAGRVAGVMGIGGSGGTVLITNAMRALPIGLPKLMVSTVASGNVAPYVGSSDITMMYSVVDIAGLNAVSRRVLGNAAHAMAGMVQYPVPPANDKPTLGMTMFGVTTPCVTAVREVLEAQGFDCLVFHATGTGGRSMEKLVEAGLIRGVLDITTTEVADEVVGGILPAGPHRFEAILRAKVPFVLSLGALDMVNFGALATVPERFQDRRLHVHNAQVTLMRTTPEENRQFARWIASKLEPRGSAVPDPHPGGRRLRDRCTRTAVLRSRGRCSPLRRAGIGRIAGTGPFDPPLAASYQRSRFRTSPGRGIPQPGPWPTGESNASMPESRATIMERLRKKAAAGLPVIGGGAGTGISAKCEEAGGIDLIVIYNSGRFRMAGRGSMAGLMPYGNANAIVKEMAHEVLTAVRHTPVLAGVCAAIRSCSAIRSSASSRTWDSPESRTSRRSD